VAGGALAIGGSLAGTREATDNCERYDVVSGAWTPAAPLPFAMAGAKAVVLRSGLIMAVAMHVGWALYDPDRDVWTRSQRLQRARLAVVELADGRVAFFGSVHSGYPPETVFALDTSTSEYTVAGSTQLPRGDSAAALLPDGTVLLVGGTLFHNLDKEPEVWDPAAGRGQAPHGLEEILDRQVRNLATQRLIANPNQTTA
jgi:hypothetical protein